MKSLTQYLLTESSTADATNAEMAICLAYNMKRIQTGDPKISMPDLFAQGLEKAGIKPGKWKKVGNKQTDLLAIGNKVTADSGMNWGDYLSHAGSTDAATNYYKSKYKLKATDTTSKSDFTSTTNNAWNISLKKSGGTGPGAQIMSAKAGEAEGVFRAGIGHYRNNGGAPTINAATEGSLDQLWIDMSESASNKLVIQVAGGKKDFANWYKGQTTNSRRRELTAFSGNPSTKQIDAHLDAEMDLLGIPQLARNAANKKKKLLYNLADRKGNKLFKEPRSFKKMESTKDITTLVKYETEYKKDSKWTVGHGYTINNKGTAVQTKSGRVGTAAVVVNPDHLGSNYETVLADNAKLKKLIADVVNTSIATKEWATSLEEFYKDNDDLKRWFLYEAGSGLFKFTGNYSTGKPYKSTMSPVANKLVVFDNSGVDGDPITILDWANTHKGVLDSGNVQISYKTSGVSGYAAIRLAAEYESELPLLQEEIRILKSQYMLNEGVFSWVKDKLSVLLDKVKNIVKTFVENVIKKFIDWLKKLAKKGHDLFMEAMGIEGSVHIPTPSW